MIATQEPKRSIVVNTKSVPVITIDPGLQRLLPELPGEDYDALKADIAANGVRDCLLVWSQVDAEGEERWILIDGHNRYRAWEELGKDPQQLPVCEMEFEERAVVESWMIANQLMRRNLTDERRAYFRGLAYRAAKATGFKGNQHTESGSGQSDHKQNTAQKLGKQFGVSEKTLRRNAAFAEAVDALPSNEQRERVLSGKEKLPKAVKPDEPVASDSADEDVIMTDVKEYPETEQIPLTGNKEKGPEAPRQICSVDDLSSLTLTDPQEATLAIFRVLGKAEDCIRSLSPVAESERVRLVTRYRGLQTVFDGLLKTVEEMPVLCPKDVQEEEEAISA